MKTEKLSPHVKIYKFPLVSISSITNRLTGLYLSGVFLSYGIIKLQNKEDYIYNLYNSLDKYKKKIINYSFIFPSIYHTCGGIRHLIWDKYPKLLNVKQTRQSSIFLYTFSSLSTIIVEDYLNK